MDYKALYYMLLGAQADAIERLQAAHRKAERLFMDGKDEPLSHGKDMPQFEE